MIPQNPPGDNAEFPCHGPENPHITAMPPALQNFPLQGRRHDRGGGLRKGQTESSANQETVLKSE